jgi:hypothetical protein
MTQMTEAQKQVLTNIARRLRRQAADLLEKFCGMLHATETQLAWTKGSIGGNKPS